MPRAHNQRGAARSGLSSQEVLEVRDHLVGLVIATEAGNDIGPDRLARVVIHNASADERAGVLGNLVPSQDRGESDQGDLPIGSRRRAGRGGPGTGRVHVALAHLFPDELLGVLQSFGLASESLGQGLALGADAAIGDRVGAPGEFDVPELAGLGVHVDELAFHGGGDVFRGQVSTTGR